MPRASARRQVGVVLLVGLALAMIVLAGQHLVPLAITSLRALAGTVPGGGAGPLVYLLAGLFTLLTVLLPFPAEASALLNGTLFPPTHAFALTWVAAMIGVTLSYEIGFRVGRGPAQRLIGAERLARVEALLARAGWPTLLALRLSPVMAFTAINWASGILSLSRPVYYWTAAVGLLPGTYVFSVVPHLLEDGGSVTLLVAAAVAVVAGLLAMSYLRVRTHR